MSRNSLTEYEVSIVKALLDRGDHNNQQIAGMINRYRGGADKDVSSGRISNIKNNQIQKYVPIKKATKRVLNAFLDELNNNTLQHLERSKDPTSDSVITQMLPLKAGSKKHLEITETDKIECKESFKFVIKTAAAFANNKGGYFVCGVKDKTWELVGLDKKNLKKFEEYDLKDANQKIRSHLGIDLQIQKKKINIAGKKLGIIHVPPAHTKPVILIKAKSDESASEGHIYYRYSGEDRLISPTDLQRIIEDRIRQLSETVLTQHISKIINIGPTNAAVMDVKTGQVDGPAGSFVIDESLLSELNFIKEGEFDEKSGAPTLKVIGSLVGTDEKTVAIQLENLTNDDLIQNFLQQNIVPNPSAFIKRLAHTQTKWLPVYYYINLANTNESEVIKILKAEKGAKNSIKNQVSRLNEKQVFKAASQNADKNELIQKAKKKETYDLSKMSVAEKRQLLYAIQNLEKSEIDEKYILNLLKNFYDNEFPNAEYAIQSLIRGAVCYVDMLLYE